MANRETNVATAAQGALSFDLPVDGTTVELESTIGFPAVPFYAVIDPAEDDLREVILVDAGKDSDSLFLSSPSQRGLDGTENVAHTAGAVIGVYPVAALWDDINDRVDAVQSDHDLHTHDGSDTPAVSLTNISGHGIAAHADLHVPVGTIVMWPASGLPSRWLECDGSAVSRTTFADLFSVMGTTHGAGDGSTTFNLPDMRDVLAIGASATKAVGDTGGSETHAHTNSATDTAGSHAHTQADSGSAGSHDHGGTDTAGSHAHSNPNTGTSGAHRHTQPASTGANGDHAHTNSSTGSGGGHGHGSTGSHDHSMGSSNSNNFVASGAAINVATQGHEHNIHAGGSHSHGSVSGHSHSVGNTGSNGNHAHGLSAVNSNGDHGHNQGNTGSNGNHAHGISAAANHAHSNPSTDSGGGHTHTQADTGSASSLPPWLAVSFIIYAGT